MAERSKALAAGITPKWYGFESHRCYGAIVKVTHIHPSLLLPPSKQCCSVMFLLPIIMANIVSGVGRGEGANISLRKRDNVSERCKVLLLKNMVKLPVIRKNLSH